MCAVSMMHDYFRQNVTPEAWDPYKFRRYKDLIKLMEELDKLFNQPDCADPEKAEWLKDLEDRLTGGDS